MLSRELEETLRRAMANAASRSHEFATLEHLLMALTEDNDALEVLNACEVNVDELKQKLADFIEDELHLSSIRRLRIRFSQQPVSSVLSSGRLSTPSRQAVMWRLVQMCWSRCFQNAKSHAVWFLKSLNMTRLDAVSYLSHGSDGNLAKGIEDVSEGDNGETAHKDALSQYAVNLINKAAAGKIDPLIGRDRELDRTIQVLCRRTKNNPLYVGDPGVGKTAIAEGLALRIYEGTVPEVLSNSGDLCA